MMGIVFSVIVLAALLGGCGACESSDSNGRNSGDGELSSIKHGNQTPKFTNVTGFKTAVEQISLNRTRMTAEE